MMKKRTIKIWLLLSCSLNIVLIGLTLSFFVSSRGEEVPPVQEDDSQFNLQQLAKANYSLLHHDYEGALEKYLEVKVAPFDDQQWVTLVQEFVQEQQLAQRKLDSLKNVTGFLYQLNRHNEVVFDSIENNFIASNLQIDSLQLILESKHENMEALLTTQQGLEKQIDALKHATGQIEFDNEAGQHVKYYGELKDGKANGYGIAFFESKGIYEGTWNDNIRHGQGKYIWANGDVYEGQFVNGKREGHGIYTFATKEKYVGEWENDVRDGHGVVYAKNGSVLLDGNWQSDQFVRKPKGNKK